AGGLDVSLGLTVAEERSDSGNSTCEVVYVPWQARRTVNDRHRSPRSYRFRGVESRQPEALLHLARGRARGLGQGRSAASRKSHETDAARADAGWSHDLDLRVGPGDDRRRFDAAGL